MADLIFNRPRHTGGPVHLVFGAGAPVGVPDPVTVTGTTTLGGVSSYGLALYDNRNPRRATVAAALPHQVAARTLAAPQSTWGNTARRLGGTATAWQQARAVVGAPSLGWQTSGRAAAATAVPWGLGTPVHTLAALVHQAAARVASAAAAPWQVASQGRAVQAAIVHQAALTLLAQATTGWSNTARLQALACALAGVAVPRAAQLLAPWQVARPTPPGREVWPRPGTGTTAPRVPSTHLVFACPSGWLGSGPVHLVFGRVCGLPVGPSAPVFILPARYYMAVHSLTAHRLPDLTPVPIFDLTLSADAGSFGWTCNASAPVSAFEALAPTAGLPAQVRFTLDGMQFVFAVDSLQRSESFGTRTVRFSGRSATALLASPYARETQRTNGAPATAQQLAEAALEFTGIGLDWGLADWLVPAGAYSHSGTPLAAVQAIVEAAGGYLQSHRSAPTLLARHPYPELPSGILGGPWNWGGAFAADVELAPDALITQSIERRDGPDINAVYVSGTTQGVLALVRRTGTAADKLASFITDPLITEQEAAQQRGLCVLGAAGPKHLVSLELPVLTGAGQPGVLSVGQLVQVNTTAPWRGRVRSVGVNARMPSVRQTVQLERHLEIV